MFRLWFELGCLFCSDAVHAHRLQRAHQPVSDWLQEHPHHNQYGVAERRRRLSEEKARG